MIAFLDPAPLIYLIEGAEPLAGKVRNELMRLAAEHPGLGIALSRLAWLECRIRPTRHNDGVTLAAYDAFFGQPDLIWVEVSKEVIELAMLIRFRHGLRTPDAIHAASALQLGGEHIFLTGNGSFRRVAGLNTRIIAAQPETG